MIDLTDGQRRGIYEENSRPKDQELPGYRRRQGKPSFPRYEMVHRIIRISLSMMSMPLSIYHHLFWMSTENLILSRLNEHNEGSGLCFLRQVVSYLTFPPIFEAEPTSSCSAAKKVITCGTLCSSSTRAGLVTVAIPPRPSLLPFFFSLNALSCPPIPLAERHGTPVWSLPSAEKWQKLCSQNLLPDAVPVR